MQISKRQAWTVAGILFALYLISNWFAGTSPAPGYYGEGYPYGSGYDPAWYGDPGAMGMGHQSPNSGYGMTGVEVINNPDATDWRDMIFIAD